MWPCQRRGHNCPGGRGTLGVEFLELAATVRFYGLSFLRCAPASGSHVISAYTSSVNWRKGSLAVSTPAVGINAADWLSDAALAA